MKGLLFGLLVVLATVMSGCAGDEVDALSSTTIPGASTSVASTLPTTSAVPAAPTTTVVVTTTVATPERFFSVDDLVFDQAGVLWATTGDDRRFASGVSYGTPRYLYRLVGDVWQLVEQPTTVFDDPKHWEIRAADGGGVFVASGFERPPSPTSGVYFTDGENWELYSQEFLCHSLAVDTRGTLWATCPDFLTRLVDGRWVDVPEGWAAWGVAAGSDGSVWFVGNATPTEAAPLWHFDGRRWQDVAVCFEPGDSCTMALAGVGPDGAAWVSRGGCGRQGLSRVDPSGEIQSFDIRGARDVAFGPDGDIWVAVPCDDADADAGLVRMSDGEIQLLTTDDGLPANQVQAVETGPNGIIYIGTEYGVSRYDPQSESWVPVGNL